MNNFNKGIDFAFEYIEKNLLGKSVNGALQGVVTKEMLADLKKKIPKKCEICQNPCGQSWCPTKTE